MATETITYIVEEVVYRPLGRTATLKQVTSDSGWERFRVTVPLEQPCDPGDLLKVTVEWPDAEAAAS